VEPVRGNLTVWLVRRDWLDAGLLIRRGRSRFLLRPCARWSAPLVLTLRCDLVELCNCNDRINAPPPAPPTPERPKLELDWPSDLPPPNEAAVVRTVARYETETTAESAFDVFI